MVCTQDCRKSCVLFVVPSVCLWTKITKNSQQPVVPPVGKLLCVNFNAQGRWPKDYFTSLICLERMLMIRCQFSVFFPPQCLANCCPKKEGLLLLLCLYILPNKEKWVIQSNMSVPSPAGCFSCHLLHDASLCFSCLSLLLKQTEGSGNLSSFSYIQHVSPGLFVSLRPNSIKDKHHLLGGSMLWCLERGLWSQGSSVWIMALSLTQHCGLTRVTCLLWLGFPDTE